MTMKNRKTLAAVAAVLLALCLVFMAPVGAEGTGSSLPEADTSGNIKLTQDVVLSQTWTINSDSTITLDLAGHTISQTLTTSPSTDYAMIENLGSLTITDSVGSGKISFAQTIPDSDTTTKWDDGYYTIQNKGTLTVNGGTIESLSTKEVAANGCPHAIDVQAGTVTIYGGKVINNNYTAIRIDSTTSSPGPTVKITGGEIIGAVDLQNANTGDQYATLDITGGTLTANGANPNAIRFINFGNTQTGMKLTISGGTINGGVVWNNYGSATGSWADVLTVNGGTFTDPTILNYLGENADVTVKLDKDVTNLGQITIANGGKATLNLNGHSITFADSVTSKPIYVTHGKLDVTGKGTINAPKLSTVSAVIYLRGSSTDASDYSVVSIGDDVTIKSTTGYGIVVGKYDTTDAFYSYGVVVTIAGTIDAPYCISINGLVNNMGGNVPKITVTDTGKLIASNGVAIYAAGYGNWEIADGAQLSGSEALSIKSGKFTINGGTFTATGDYKDPANANNNGSEDTGAALSITSNDNYATEIEVTINGGEFISDKGHAVYEGIGLVACTTNNCGHTNCVSKDGNFFVKGDDENPEPASDDSHLKSISIKGGKFQSKSSTIENVICLAKSDKKYFVSGGTFSSDVSKYVAENYLCIAKDKTSFEVIEKPAAAVIPETVPGVESGSDNSGKSIIKAPAENVIDKTSNDGFVEISSTKEEVSVSFVITGAKVTEGNDGKKVITLSEDAEITANYEMRPVSDGTNNVGTFQLSIKIDNVTKSLPVIDATVDKTIMEGHDIPVKSVLAMITALGADRNENLAKGEGNKITIIFTVHASAIENLNNIVAYHVDGNGKKTRAEMGNPEKSGNGYIIPVRGEHFSSYVLVEEEPTSAAVDSIPYTGGSATDTGSGNYQYYPRDVPTNGIVDFGTSKVVTGIELPAGSSGKVTLNIKPDFTMPENGYYTFEIDAPGYNLDAKINGGISFQIPVADLTDAGWTAKDIVLYHGTVAEDGTINWEALPTNLVKNENGIAYYKAAINGCSPFYIGFVKDGSIINTEVVEPVTPPTETPDVPTEVLPPAADEPADEPTESPAPILAVLAGLGAAVVLRRK